MLHGNTRSFGLCLPLGGFSGVPVVLNENTFKWGFRGYLGTCEFRVSSNKPSVFGCSYSDDNIQY